MKRLFSLLFAAVMLLGLMTSALADTPKPIEVVPYEELPEPYDGQHHYLMLCMDSWSSDHARLGNTDGIVLVTLDTRAHRIMLTSLIRDALVDRVKDGKEGIGRVNYVAKDSSPEYLCQVLSQHLGVKIEKYVLFNFSQVQNIIDYLGGVDITINSAEASYLMRYPLSPNQTKPAVTREGTYLFGGRAAVIYMRIRKAGGGGDFMRTQRARTVLSTLADKCRTMTYEEARALVDSVMENSTMTNISLDDMVTAMEYAYSLRDCTIEELRIPQDGTYHAISYAGMAVQELDWNAARFAMEDYLQNSFLVMDDEDDF